MQSFCYSDDKTKHIANEEYSEYDSEDDSKDDSEEDSEDDSEETSGKFRKVPCTKQDSEIDPTMPRVTITRVGIITSEN